jgi:hypothetical protein
MDFIVDGGCVCEPCLRLTTAHKVILHNADHEIASLREQLARLTRENGELRKLLLECHAFIQNKSNVAQTSSTQQLIAKLQNPTPGGPNA